MKKFLTSLLIIIILACVGLFIAQQAGANLSFLNIFSCSNRGEHSDDTESEQQEVFEGEMDLSLVESNDIIYPSYKGTLMTTTLPDTYYISFNDDVKEIPKGTYYCTKYTDYYKVRFNGRILYDSIDAGEYVATFYAYYNADDNMLKIDEQSVNVEDDLYKGDYLIVGGKFAEGMYNDKIQNEQNFIFNFELIEDGFMYPTVTLLMYLRELPSMVQVRFNEQTIEIDINKFNITKYNNYFKLEFNESIKLKRISKGYDEIKVEVYRDDNCIRQANKEFYSAHDYYFYSYVANQNGEKICAMDSNDYWSGWY